MNCDICGKPIVLVPSAEERARTGGGRPEDYTKLFTTHAQCQIEKNRADTLELVRKLKGKL